jgi:serine protease Do
MRRFLISCSAIAAVCLLLCQPLAAQDKEKDKDKDKDKNKVSENEEIIIKRKGDKDSKITIEIKGDDIMVNGKPLDEFIDDNIVVKKGKTTTVYGFSAPHSPFRGQSGSLSFSSEGFDSNAAFLGVITENDDRGARIEDVTENSAAEKAGLKDDDIITKIDETKIERPEDLTKIISKHKPNDKISITYYRDGKSNKTEATLGKRKGKTMTLHSPQFDAQNFNFDWKDHDFGPRLASGRPRLGIKAQDTEDGKGVKVLDVDNGSTAEKAGVQVDDVITEFDGRKINSTDELVDAARDAKDKPVIKITFLRDGKAQTVEIKTPRKLKTANL